MKRDLAFELLGDTQQWTLSAVLRRQAAARGSREFIRFGDAGVLTYADFDTRADALARSLLASGVSKGDRVFVMVRNGVEFMLLSMACGRAGAIFVPVNTELKGYSLQHQLINCGARIVFAENALLPQFEGIEASATSACRQLVITGGSAPANMSAALRDIASSSYEDFAATGSASLELVEPAPHEIGCIMYTSGTTGPAKGVLMPHAHLALFSVPSSGLQMTADDVYYVCMPLFHANALFTQVFASMVCGGRVHCVERFSPNRWLNEVRACGATVTNSLGIMTEMLHKTPHLDTDADNPLRVVLAVPVADWIGEFARRFGVRVVQGYGMTESNMVAYATVNDPVVPGCCGSLRPELFDVAILDPETDVPVADGEIGEVCVRPRIPNAFMQGYFGMPDKTAEAWRNLWFHTGDAGRLQRTDTGTLLFFGDRIKDRIRRRGENVSAFEVEQVLGMLDGVAESAVVGIYAGDEGAEQEIKACIVRKADSTLTHVQVLEHCIANVPRFAVPRFIEFLDALPKTPSNKVQKHLLRASGAGAGCWDREREGYSSRNDRRAAPAKTAGAVA